jgi:glycosyltransferase involved in cell wall biosynthesis
MGENARKTVMEKFTWNKIAQDTKAVYYKVVE